MNRQLVVPGPYELHSGGYVKWKIECDALTDEDLDGIAFVLAEMLPPFGSVEGVPRGGLRLATALAPYVAQGPVLIVDDVCTTGASLEEQRRGRPDAIGAVIFARGPLPPWCKALFYTEGAKSECSHPGMSDRTGQCSECSEIIGHLCRDCRKTFIPPWEDRLTRCGWCFLAEVY